MRRSGQSDQRRRRVLTDDGSSATDTARTTAVRAPNKTANTSGYSAGALDNQPRITAFVPLSRWAFLLLLLWAGGIGAGLLAAYQWLDPTAAPRAQVLDVTAPGSLAGWFASLLLGLIAATSIVCFSLRRRRLSDYHNRYRVWVWTAMLGLVASASAVSPWHVLAGDELARAIGWKLPGGGTLYWLVPTVLVFATLAIRLLLEMRDSRVATAGLLAAILAYAVVAGAHLLGNADTADRSIVTIVSGSLLGGHVLLLLSFLWYARFTILDIQGLIPARDSDRPSAKTHGKSSTLDSSSGDDRTSRRIDQGRKSVEAPHGRTDLEPDSTVKQRSAQLLQEVDEDDEQDAPRRANPKKVRKERRQATEDFDDFEDDAPRAGGTHQKLSKSDRKKLRRLKAQQREAA